MKRRRVVVGVAVLVLVGGLWWLRGAPQSAPSEAAADSGAGAVTAMVGAAEEGPGLDTDLRFGVRASIAGTVKDPQGRPVAGAQVCASARSERLAGPLTRRPTCATSERDGHYRIEGLFGVPHEVVAGAPSFVPTLYVRGEGAARREWIDLRPATEALGIDIVLEDGGVEVRGVVRDLSGGPIEGAQVKGYRTTPALTGPEGEFSMWVRPGTVGLAAEAEGYAGGQDIGAAPGHLFELFMTPEAVVVGKVVRAGDGTPVEGIGVSLGGGWGTRAPSAETDANGEFRIDRLNPGVYKLRAESDDLYGQADEQVTLGLGETSEPIVVTAHPAFSIEGRVVGESGASCDSGWVQVQDAELGLGRRASIEPDGRVRLTAMRAGEYAVQVSCDGYVPEDKYDEVKLAERSVSGLEWRVSRGQAIRGRVVDARGGGVRELEVAASPRVDPSRPREQRMSTGRARTDASGGFVLAGLMAGTYDLSVSAWSPTRATPPKPLEVTLPKGQDAEGLRIVLPATGEVRGTVRDAKGRPVRKAEIVLLGEGSHFSASAGDDGGFRVENVAAGEYRAMAQKGWESLRAPGTSDDDVQGEKIAVSKDKVTTVNLVVADAAGEIAGVVHDEDGAAVADAFVAATRESDSAAASAGQAARDGRWNSHWQTPHLTDADGRFRLSELVEGTYTLHAHRKGGGEAIIERVAVGSEGVTLKIAAAGRMTGTVVVRGGRPPEEFAILILDELSGFRRYDQFYRTGGAWSFPELPAGKYKVRVNAGPGSAETEVTLAAGQELSGVRLELAPRVTVRGTVTDLEGKPVPGLQVSVDAGNFGSIAPTDRSNVTDESGRFECPNAPTGPVQIRVSPLVHRNSEFSGMAMPGVLAADAATVELAPIRVTRKRVRDGDVIGDLGYKIREREPGSDPQTRRWIVAHLRADGPAAAAGLRVGDEIVAVDGQDVVDANLYLYTPLTRVAPGTTLTLGLARGASVQVTASAPP